MIYIYYNFFFRNFCRYIYRGSLISRQCVTLFPPLSYLLLRSEVRLVKITSRLTATPGDDGRRYVCSMTFGEASNKCSLTLNVTCTLHNVIYLFLLSPCILQCLYHTGIISYLKFKAVMVLPAITQNYGNYPYSTYVGNATVGKVIT